ncbi:MAG: single-stranded-DNA-specific exonuclease RecJ [Clostridia bacterium]|nr:single-stranded-DNA-specific exonuclease RecJ [Clostridia bacterium]
MQSWIPRGDQADNERVEKLAREMKLKNWQARLLAVRGADTPEGVRRFLDLSFDSLDGPETLPGIAEMTAVIEGLKAEKPRARIAVYGDYDVDGVCASAIMKEALDGMGFDVRVYIPDRHEEGYGLNAQAVRRLKEGTAWPDPWPADMILTVDCGITSLTEAALAKELGLKIIVTDHHTRLEELPDADVVVSPVLEGSGRGHFPFLCGAGVALKAAWALRGKEFARDRCDLCALATVADVVPLEGENRTLVAEGLKKMARSPRCGIRALMEVSGLNERHGPVTSEAVAFQLAPRLNAAGRLESAMLSCRLMLTEDAGEAEEIAQALDRLNTARRFSQDKVIAEAEAQAEKMCLRDVRALVCVGEGWDSGVVGLAAGRLAEKYACPAVCLARTGEICVGSARSACGVDLYAALVTCRDLFERFGGHKAAAGLTIRFDRVEEFRERLSRAVARQLGEGDLIPVEEYDAEMPLEDVTLENVAWINSLAPFGAGNPSPVFLISDASMEGRRTVGKDFSHLQFSLEKDGEMRKCVYFRGAAWLDSPRGRVSVLAVPGENTFNHRTSVQLRIQSARQTPEDLEKEEAREDEVLLKDLTDIAEMSGGAELCCPPLPSAAEKAGEWLREKRGTLILCRTLESALKWHRARPDLSLVTGKADDPRAFTVLALYVPLREISPHYSRIILADGTLPGEIGLLLSGAPERQVCADGSSASPLMDRVTLDRTKLNKVYLALKIRSRTLGLRGMTRTEMAKETGLEDRRLYCALHCLAAAELIGFAWSPFQVEMKPFKKADPDGTAWEKLVCRQ